MSDGAPALDAEGRVVPVFTPGVSRVENWLATRGAEIDVTTNVVLLYTTAGRPPAA